MRPSVMVANVMESQIKICRKCLSQGVHVPSMLETLKVLNDVRKLVENFETTILDVDID